MTDYLTLSRVALGPATGAATFLLLTGGHFPRARPRPLGRAMHIRWLALVATAALEELVWRGIVLRGLVVLVGLWVALAVSSVAFAIWHAPALRGRCAVHLVTGGTFGGAFLVGGIVAAMLAHTIYNLLVDWAVQAERARPRGP